MPYTASNFPGSFNELILTPHTHTASAPLRRRATRRPRRSRTLGAVPAETAWILVEGRVF